MLYISTIDVTGLLTWLSAIAWADWPQQHKLRGQLRPAMVTDPRWFGFGAKATPLVHDLMGYFPGCTSHQWMLSAVMPGHEITPHVDEQPPQWVTRVHVPLMSNPDSLFIVDGKAYQMAPGSAYKVNTRLEHSVTNSGDVPRVHFMFDVWNASPSIARFPS